MKRNVLIVMTVVLSVCAISVSAETQAYWRFEEGPAGAQVPKVVGGPGYEVSTLDSSGHGYDLSVWDTGGAGYIYRSDVAYSTVPQTGVANNFAVKNSGGGPAMWTDPTDAISSITPAAFTIEATFKLENGGYRTIAGRDSYGTYAADMALAAMYFQAMPDNKLAIKYCDVDGNWHEAVSAANIFQSYDYGTNPNGNGVPWYSMAGVSDGSTLSLYLNEIGTGTWQLLASTALGTGNTAMTKGLGSAGDWTAGEWTVGRGLHNGGHVDRGYGFIDEVRISDSALTTSEFLVPEPATMILLGLGGLMLKRRS